MTKRLPDVDRPFVWLHLSERDCRRLLAGDIPQGVLVSARRALYDPTR
jgi:hypothetical protein